MTRLRGLLTAVVAGALLSCSGGDAAVAPSLTEALVPRFRWKPGAPQRMRPEPLIPAIMPAYASATMFACRVTCGSPSASAALRQAVSASWTMPAAPSGSPSRTRRAARSAVSSILGSVVMGRYLTSQERHPEDSSRRGCLGHRTASLSGITPKRTHVDGCGWSVRSAGCGRCGPSAVASFT
jgi:hypothetical protein